MAWAILTCVVVGVFIILPFFVGKGGMLVSAASETSSDNLKKLKTVILQKYISEENAFRLGEISPMAWNKRKQFLVNRYVDASRRLDFLAFVEAHQDNKNA